MSCQSRQAFQTRASPSFDMPLTGLSNLSPAVGLTIPLTAGALNPKPCKKTFDLQSHMLQPAPYKLSPETNWAWMWSFHGARSRTLYPIGAQILKQYMGYSQDYGPSLATNSTTAPNILKVPKKRA